MGTIQNSINTILGTTAAAAYAINKNLEGSVPVSEAKEALPKVEENLASEAAQTDKQAVKDVINSIKSESEFKGAMKDAELYAKDPEAFNKKIEQSYKQMTDADAAVKADKAMQAKIEARQVQLQKAKAQSNTILGKKKFVSAVKDEKLEQAHSTVKKILTGGNK